MITNFAKILEKHAINQQLINQINVNPILQQWQENKKGIYKLFNNQLVIKQPFKSNPTEEQIEYAEDKFFLFTKQYQNILNQIDKKSLVTNYLQKTTTIDNKTYPQGMKLTKIFRKILNDDKEFKYIDRIYGNFLQTLNLNGNLCISIDPIDFLTMGDNANKWSSCHSLLGEFKGGILSLLTDASTIVCYLESNKKPYIINDVIASNKKWRQLIHIDPDFPYIVFNSQYPFEHNLIQEAIYHMFQKIYNTNLNILEYETTNIKMTDYVSDYNFHGLETLHFNDLFVRKKNGKYENDYLRIVAQDEAPEQEVIVGNLPYCPICGEYYISCHKSIECNHCNPLEYCCTCGNHFHRDTLHHIDSELYCDSCFDNVFTYCEQCDEIIRRAWVDNNLHDCTKELLTI